MQRRSYSKRQWVKKGVSCIIAASLAIAGITPVGIKEAKSATYSFVDGNNISWTFSIESKDGKQVATKVYTTSEHGTTLTVPEKMEDYSVYSIGGGTTSTTVGGKKSGTVKLKFPSSVREISIGACYDYNTLSSIEILGENNVVTLGDSAFQGCSVLTGVEFPKAETVGSNTFSGCGALTGLSLPVATAIGRNAFSQCGEVTSISIPRATTIGNNAFTNCTKMEKVNIESAITIGSSAFQSCSSLKKVHLPSSVTSLGTNAFQSCNGLTSVELDANLDYANQFSNLSKLENIVIGEQVSSIAYNAFAITPNWNTGLKGVNSRKFYFKNAQTKIHHTNSSTGRTTGTFSATLTYNSLPTKYVMAGGSSSGSSFSNEKELDADYWNDKGVIVPANFYYNGTSTYNGVAARMVLGVTGSLEEASYPSKISLASTSSTVSVPLGSGTTELNPNIENISVNSAGVLDDDPKSRVRLSYSYSYSDGNGGGGGGTYTYAGHVYGFNSSYFSGAQLNESAKKKDRNYTMPSTVIYVVNGIVGSAGSNAVYPSQMMSDSNVSVALRNSGNCSLTVTTMDKAAMPSYRPESVARYTDSTGKTYECTIADDGSFNMENPTNLQSMVDAGWTFVGWNSEKTATTAVTKLPADRDAKIFPIFTKEAVVAKFQDVSKTDVAKSVISSAQEKVNVDLPEMKGDATWAPVGWTLGKSPDSDIISGKVEISLDTEPTTIYGIVKNPDGAGIKYDSDKGGELPEAKGVATVANTSNLNVVIAEESVTLESVKENARGYNFRAWDVQGHNRQPGDEVTVTTKEIAEALWTPVNYKVAYHANGGSGQMETENFVFGVPKKLLKNTFTKEGKVFTGWAKSAGGESVLADESTITDLGGTEGEVVDLYAVWTDGIFDVTYDYRTNGGTSATKSTMSQKYGSDVDISVTATKTGWKFKGWNTNPNAREGLESMSMPGRDVTLYAIFCKEVITVFVDSDGKKSISSDVWGAERTVSVAVPEVAKKEEYEFAGWTKSKEAGDNIQTESDFEVPVTGVMTYYALYSAEVTAAFHLGDDVKKLTGISWYNASGSAVKAQVVAPDVENVNGWKANGWMEEGADWIVSIKSGENLSIAKNTEFWVMYSKDVTLSLSTGEKITRQAVWNSREEVAPIFNLPAAEKTGYSFVSWSIDGRDYEPGQNVVLASSTEAKANFVPNTYEVLFTGGEGQIEPIKAIYDQNFVLPACSLSKTLKVKLDADGGECNQVEITTKGKFKKWKIGGKEYSAGEGVKNLIVSGSIQAEAVWDAVSVELPKATKKNYEFSGWSDGTKTWKEKFTPTSDCTLKAAWTPAISKVVINSDGLTGNTLPDIELTKGETSKALEGKTIPKKEFKVNLDYDGLLEHHTEIVSWKFTGLWTEKNSGGTQYFDKNLKAVKEWDLIGDQTLYVGWEESGLTLPNPTFDGYLCKGWSDGTKVWDKEFVPMKDSTLKIVLEPKTFAVKLNPAGGKVEKNQITYTYGKGLALPAAKRDGFIFTGWYNSEGDRLLSVGEKDFGDMELSAHWLEFSEENRPSGDKTITEAKVPSTMTAIPDGYFKGCTNLDNVEIEPGVTSIGANAFSGCENLKEISIPNSVIVIEDGAFQNCTKLEEIKLPNGLLSMGENSFSGCTGLKGVDVPNTVLQIGSAAFKDCTSLESIKLPASVQLIGADAFVGCRALKKVVIDNPSCILEGGSSLFPAGTVLYGPSPSTVEEFAKTWGYQFVSTEKAYEMTVEDGLNLGKRIIYTRKSLPPAIEIPGVVGNDANLRFGGYELAKDTIGITGTIKASSLVYDSNGYLMRDDLDGTKEIILKAKWNCGQNAEKTLPKRIVKYVKVSDGVQISGVKKSATSVTIPDVIKVNGKKLKVTEIKPNAFKNYENLKKVSIGKNVRRIGARAFQGCTNLKKVTMPKSVKSVGKAAFKNCKNLKMIKASSKKLKIGKNAVKGTAKNLRIETPVKLRKKYKEYFSNKGNNSLLV